MDLLLWWWLSSGVLSFFFFLFLLFLLSKKIQSKERRSKVVAFFHPYCNDGGGGERVLWCSVLALQQMDSEIECYIFAGRDKGISPEQILQRTKERFNIRLLREPIFVFLDHRWLVEASTWPRFTLIGQSFGSILLAFEALLKSTVLPTTIIDSMGYAFTFPVFKLFGKCRVGCYVHYPTISTDMLDVVSKGKSSHNNSSLISRSKFISRIKLRYYQIFANLYGYVGSFAEVVMVNSTWTYGHINSLWKIPKPIAIVYPPCNTSDLLELPLGGRSSYIISIGQFRPEKDHNLQLESFALFLNDYPHWKSKVELILIGSSRKQEDNQRVQQLKKRREELGLVESVRFKVNLPFSELKEWLGRATIGLHTMWNEHFGIGIVEFMAAGVIPVAHNSGGPKEDIVVPFEGKTTGFLASTAKEYSKKFNDVFSLSESDRMDIQKAARSQALKFSDEEYSIKFKNCVRTLLP